MNDDPGIIADEGVAAFVQIDEARRIAAEYASQDSAPRDDR